MVAADNPYVGPDPFTEEHGRYFFGRKKDSRLIAINLLAAPLLVVYGRSGVGKTSIIRAGVPGELAKIEEVCVVYFNRWVTNAPDNLLNEIEESAGIAAEAGESLDHFAMRSSATIRKPLVLLLDQFEEYFQYRGNYGHDEFERALATLINDTQHDVHIMISMRADALSRLDAFNLRIPQILLNTLEIENLKEAAATQAIRGPVEEFNKIHSTNFQVTADFVGLLIEQTLDRSKGFGASVGVTASRGIGASGISTPFLQLALFKLWREMQARNANDLSETLLESLGGVDGIAQSHLAGQLKESGVEGQVLEVIFDRLVTFDGMKIAASFTDLAERVRLSQGTDDATKHDYISEDQLKAVLNRLVSGRILNQQSEDLYEIQHDVLARPILNWIRESRVEREERTKADHRVKVEREGAEQKRQKQKRQSELVAFILFALLSGTTLYTYLVGQKNQSDIRTLQDLARLTTEEAEQRDPETAALYALKTIEFFPDAFEDRAAQNSMNHALYAVSNGTGRSSILKSNPRQLKPGDKRLLKLGSHLGQVWSVAISADSKHIGSASGDRTAVIWDVEPEKIDAKKKCSTVNHDKAVRSIAFKPGKSAHEFMTASEDGRVRFWNSETCTELPDLELKTEPLGRAHEKWARTAVYSEDGRWIATGSSTDRSIRIWGAGTHQLALTLRQNNEGTVALKFHPTDSNIIASASNLSNGRARLWNITDFKNVTSAIYSGHNEKLWDVAFSTDGTEIATASDDDTVNVWAAGNSVSGALRNNTRLNVFGGSAVYRDGLAEVADNVVEKEGARLRGPLPAHHFDIWAVAFAAKESDPSNLNLLDGRFATGSWDNSIKIWDSETFEFFEELRGHRGPVRDIAVSPDMRFIASGSEDGDVRMWPLEIKGVRTRQVVSEYVVKSVRIRPDEEENFNTKLQFLAIVKSGKLSVVRIYNERNAVNIAEYPSGGLANAELDQVCPVHSAEFSGMGKEIFILCEEGAVLLWNYESGKVTRQEAPKQYSRSAAIDFGIDRLNKKIVSAFTYESYEGKAGTVLQIFSVRSLSLNREAIRMDREVILTGTFNHMAIDNQGRWIALAKNEEGFGILYLSQLDDIGKIKKFDELKLTYERRNVTSLAFSDESSMLAAGSQDKAIQIWDIPKSGVIGKELTTRILQGHLGSVEDISFSSDGHLIASASSDDSVRIWDANTGFLQILKVGHVNTVTSVFFSDDNNGFVSGSVDGTVILWDKPDDFRGVVKNICGSLEARDISPSLLPSARQTFVKTYANDDGTEKSFLLRALDPVLSLGQILGIRPIRPTLEEVSRDVDCASILAKRKFNTPSVKASH